MICVVDSGVANLASVCAALRRLNAETIVTADPKIIANATRVILPGVGTASAAMAQLRAKGLIDTLRTLTQPVLGICLGLQLLFECSAEGDGTECLSVLSGTIERLPATPAEPVPHIGWNQLNCHFQNHPLLKGVLEGDYVYFVHSYAAPISDLTVASTTYGSAFTALAAQRNFMGCQFHPERSGAVGNQILANFLSL